MWKKEKGGWGLSGERECFFWQKGRKVKAKRTKRKKSKTSKHCEGLQETRRVNDLLVERGGGGKQKKKNGPPPPDRAKGGKDRTYGLSEKRKERISFSFAENQDKERRDSPFFPREKEKGGLDREERGKEQKRSPPPDKKKKFRAACVGGEGEHEASLTYLSREKGGKEIFLLKVRVFFFLLHSRKNRGERSLSKRMRLHINHPGGSQKDQQGPREGKGKRGGKSSRFKEKGKKVEIQHVEGKRENCQGRGVTYL